jgi:hypothetical protein
MSLWVDGAHHNDFELIAGKRYFSALQEFAAALESKQAGEPRR